MGLAPWPWIDFEQKVNQYMVQAKILTENVNIMISANFGIMYKSLIGGKVDEELPSTIDHIYEIALEISF